MRFRKLWDDLASGLWFRPMLWSIGLGLLALILVALDRHLTRTAIQLNLPWLFTGGPESASIILVSIGTTALTVATLTFSIIMVAVVQTANAYSPRILRQYLADTANQDVLGILVGTFVMSLLVLRATTTTADEPFIPSLSVTASIFLALVSIGAFLYFISHVAHSIEVDDIIKLSMGEAEALLPELFPGTLGMAWPGTTAPPLADELGASVVAELGGYIQFIEPAEVLAAAERADVVVRLERLTGEYVLPGMPLAMVWPSTGLTAELTEALQRAVHRGSERTLVQDLYFGVRQISDIALRALSPAVNDPTTAVNCVDALARLLVGLAQRGPISPYRAGSDGTLRVIASGPTFGATLDLAYTQIRHYGVNDFAITLRLIEVCGQIGYVATREEEREALWQHVSMVARGAVARFHEPAEQGAINERLVAAAAVLKREVEPLLLRPKGGMA
jgi:uncharacterized membrane protein